MKATRPSFWLLLLLCRLLFPANAICYYPSGDVSPQDSPCHDGTASTCCGPGYACLDNNICIATGLERQLPNEVLYVRGSCTDKTWRSGNCPNFCVNPANNDKLDGGIGMQQCPGLLSSFYCMDGAPFDCKSGENVVSFQGMPFLLRSPQLLVSLTSFRQDYPVCSPPSGSPDRLLLRLLRR